MSSKSIMKIADEAILSSPLGATRESPYSAKWFNAYATRNMIFRVGVVEEADSRLQKTGWRDAETGDIVLEIGARKTFDRWANSNDITKIIYTRFYNGRRRKLLSSSEIAGRIHSALSDADFLCVIIPPNMFNQGIRIDL